MDQMEPEDVLQNNMTDRREVSSCLMTVFRTDTEYTPMKSLLETMSNNLVFDDPGLLGKLIIFDREEQHLQDATVLWLINQLIFVVNQNMNILETVTDLQKNIIAASFMKQPALFHTLMERYIAFTQLMVDTDKNLPKPLFIDMFQQKDYDLTSIQADCQYQRIEISRIQTLCKLVHTNVRLLKHAIVQMANYEKTLTMKCNSLILNVFQTMEVSIKTACVQYFVRFFVCITEIDYDQQEILCNILEGATEIESKMDVLKTHKLVTDDEVELFIDSVCELVASPCIPLQFSDEVLNRAASICIDALQKHCAIGARSFNRMAQAIYKLLVQILGRLRDADVQESLWKLLLSSEGNQFLASDDMAFSESTIPDSLNPDNALWTVITTRMTELCIEESQSLEALHQGLCIIKLILNTAKSIEHHYESAQQLKMCRERSNEDVNEVAIALCAMTFRDSQPLRRLLPNVDLLANNILKKLTIIITQDIHDFNAAHLKLVAEIAAAILVLNDTQDIDEYTQLQLLLIALSPLIKMSELLKNHLLQEFAQIEAALRSPRIPTTSISSLIESSLEMLINFNLVYLSSKNRELLMDFLQQIVSNVSEPLHHQMLMKVLTNFFIQDSFRCGQFEIYMKKTMNDASNHYSIADGLKDYLCLSARNCFVYQYYRNGNCHRYVQCSTCDIGNETFTIASLQSELEKMNGKLLLSPKMARRSKFSLSAIYFQLIESTESPARMKMTICIPAMWNHMTSLALKLENVHLWLSPMMDPELEIRMQMAKNLALIPHLIKTSVLSADQQSAIIQLCMDKLLEYTKNALLTMTEPGQSCALGFISSFASSPALSERELYTCFCMLIYLSVCGRSEVSRLTSLTAKEICQQHNIAPTNLLTWYKTNLLKLIVPLCISNFLIFRIRLENSLTPVSQLFGFADAKGDFISKSYDIILAILITYSMKHESCFELIEELCSIMQKDQSTIFCNAFLSIYTYLHLHETPEVCSKCMVFILQNTGTTLYRHLRVNINLTTAKTLVYYHMNPNFVIHTMRNLINDSDTGSNNGEFTTKTIADYLTTRFLGVIGYFEQILIIEQYEKYLKREVLLSLGGIMRFMGSEKITPFRFKLLAVLRATVTINPSELKDICIDVWKIFISTVDVISLGPLLSTIFVSIEPLLETHPHEINGILKDLIVHNGSLLSDHIPDLFFVKDTKADPGFKKFITDYISRTHPEFTANGLIDDRKSFMSKFEGYIRHVNHDNLSVRVYGLNYLSDLFESNRDNLNKLIIGRRQIDDIIKNLLDLLMVGIKNSDESLQIATGRCIGKLGALESSLLSPNYCPEDNFAIAVNTNEFAIMALKELCKACQSQKNTNNIDGYSLAIQFILSDRGVCPSENRNVAVWEAIPERMRPVLEPLLTSCYVLTNPTFNRINVHPIFGSSRCRSFEEWAFTWATKNIECIEKDSIKALLRSFKLPIRNDVRIMAIFLPYVLLHALQFGSNNCAVQIGEELHTVFKAAINPERMSRLDKPNRLKHVLPNLDSTLSNCETETQRSSKHIEIKCAKLAFNLLDFFERWLRKADAHVPSYSIVRDVVQHCDKKLVARANFACGEYARALMYLESYIEEDRTARLQNELAFLSEIYGELADSDSLEGALNMKDTEPTLHEQIRKNNAQGRLQESVVCFERLMHVNALPINNAVDMVQCYLGLNQPEIAILVAEGLMKQLCDQNTEQLMLSTAEPLWRLGRFDELNDLIETEYFKDSSDWGIRCGQILLKMRKGDDSDFAQEIDKSRLSVMSGLRIVGDEPNIYHKGYANVIKLHLISEIEQAYKIVSDIQAKCLLAVEIRPEIKGLLNGFLNDWDARLKLLQPTVRIVEPVLCLRRILLNMVQSLLKVRLNDTNVSKDIENQLNRYIGKSWIRSAELARVAGMYQQAELYILNAESYKMSNLFTEKAKLFWQKGDQANAFKILERGFEDIQQAKNNELLTQTEYSHTYAEARLLYALYNAGALNVNADLNSSYFKEAIKARSDSEKTFVDFAQYLEKTSVATNHPQYSANYCTFQRDIILQYYNSMMCGAEYVYQSMPRVLSIWLDFTAAAPSAIPTHKKDQDSYRNVCAFMNKIMEKLCHRLQPFYFYTAFSQLVSRICHSSLEVYEIIKSIIIKLILTYPQQAMWKLCYVYKSSYASRVRRCNQIFSDKRLAEKNTQQIIVDFISLAARLIEFTEKELPKNKATLSVREVYKQLPDLLARKDFTRILLPFEKHMQPILPAPGDKLDLNNQFNPFPDGCVYIYGIRDEVTQLASLQRPRRVTLIGSDGNDYMIMMKARDDLRKDFRLMEFNAVVKNFLHQNSEARQRRLNIRTYAVIPLNEECGIMEWVPDLRTYRSILNGYYKQKGLGIGSKDLKECPPRDATDQKKQEYLKRLQAKCPPIFNEWFREQFTAPHNWHQARNSYIRTAAVMSMVGYILGLGDRHGENILMDAVNGDLVHVDFNCLFNKGDLFEIPEVVPFRLTHNMVHAMGPLGVEGQYRKCCEITLKVLQEQMVTLMSVLKPLVYDPSLSWSRQVNRTDAQTERIDSSAMTNVQKIEERLKGCVKINGIVSIMPLSTEGVVNHCILEATDIEKLARMYIGWGAYL